MAQLYVATLSFLATIISCIIWYIIRSSSQKPGVGKTPPGPRGLPILGYLPFLDKNLPQQFTELSHKYGPIFKLHLGNKPCIVISSPSLVKEVVRDKDAIFANPDTTVAALISTYGGNDIALSPLNSQWRAMRRIFAQHLLSNISLDSSYNLRKDEVRKVIRHVYTKTGKPIEIRKLSFRTELNAAMSMAWGGIIEREKTGEEFHVIVSKINHLLEKPNISDFYPLLTGLDIQGIKKQMESCMQSVDEILDAVIAEYKQRVHSGDFKNESGKNNFLQILLELQEKEDYNNSDKSISQRQTKAILMDIVAGGADTTSTTIEWAMAALMSNPEVMAKAQKELSEVVGLNNIVEEFHIPKLKYLEAVVKETMRLYPTAALVARRSPADQSSTVGKYTITKNTSVFINIWSIHRDPSIWDSATEFIPERFLHENHEKWDFRGNNFHYIPFGSGRRMCAGLPLAERVLIYFLGSYLHSFDWKLPQGQSLDMGGTLGVVYRKTTPLSAIPIARLPDSSLYV